MNDLEKGYIHIDDNGKAQYISYDTVGGGVFMIALLVLSTVLINNIGTYIINNKWIVAIPTLIAVLIRTFIFDVKTSFFKRIINIVSDVIRTICMYGVLIIIFDKIITAHWLDRVLLALFYGVILAIIYFLLSKLFSLLRTCELCTLHFFASILVATISLYIFFGHTWYWMGYDYKVSFNGASIVECDKRIVGDVEIPASINSYNVKTIGKRAFSSNKKITSIKIPNTVESIEEGAFSHCESHNSIYLPSSIKTIKKDVLYDCTALINIFFDGSQEDWDNIDIQDGSINGFNICFEK